MRCTAGGLGGEASSEAEIVPRVRWGASDGPYRGSGLWAECVFGLLWVSGVDLGVVEDLEELHGVRVQSDDRVVIIGGFVIYQPVR